MIGGHTIRYENEEGPHRVTVVVEIAPPPIGGQTWGDAFEKARDLVEQTKERVCAMVDTLLGSSLNNDET